MNSGMPLRTVLWGIYINQSQRVFFAQMTLRVMRYDVMYHPFPIKSQYLKTWGVDSPAIL